MRVALRETVRVERGFTMIEVLVAALVVAIALTGTAALVGGSLSSQSRSQQRSQAQGMAEASWEHLLADASWRFDENCTRRASGCDIDLSGLAALRDERTGIKGEAKARAVPVDSPADGLGDDDTTGTPDSFSVSLTIDVFDLDNRRLAEIPPITLSGLVDGLRGQAFGSVSIQACAAVNQVDERLTTASCGSGPIEMRGPGDGTVDRNETGARPWITTRSNQFAYARRWSAREGNPFPSQVRFRTYNARWSLRAREDDGRAATPRNYSGTTGKDGAIVVNNLPLGSYDLSVSKPAASAFPGGDQWIPWDSHWQPTNDVVHIGATGSARVVRVFQAKPVDVEIALQPLDQGIPWRGRWAKPSEVSDNDLRLEFALRPFPEGRAIMPGLSRDGDIISARWPDARTRFDRLRFQDVPPGLYELATYKHNLDDPSTRVNEESLKKRPIVGFVNPDGRPVALQFVFVTSTGRMLSPRLNGEDTAVRIMLPMCRRDTRDPLLQNVRTLGPIPEGGRVIDAFRPNIPYDKATVLFEGESYGFGDCSSPDEDLEEPGSGAG